MATDADKLKGAATVYGLFQKYASVVPNDEVYGIMGIPYQRIKKLMLDADLLEGVPPGLADAYVREHLRRADHEECGFISAPDFVIWWLTEVAALLPLRDAFCGVTGLRPLYNQYHAALLGDVGLSESVRKPVKGMPAQQFIQLAAQYGLSKSSSETVRHAFGVARANIGAYGNGGGGMRSAGGGGRAVDTSGSGWLQFAAFVRALALLAVRKGSTPEVALYLVVSCGLPPPPLLPPPFLDPITASADQWLAGAAAPPPSPRRRTAFVTAGDGGGDVYGALAASAVAAGARDLSSGGGGSLVHGMYLGLFSRLEGSASRERCECGNCGKQHTRWRLDNVRKLEELLVSMGVPLPVRRSLPYLHYISTRNLRAVFHRYNAAHNKGELPPAACKLPAHPPVGRAAADAAYEDSAQGSRYGSAFCTGSGSGSGSGSGDGDCGATPYGACCCLFRALSVMEMTAWLRLCLDCSAIRGRLVRSGPGLTPARLQELFLRASSLRGVYEWDDSIGDHDGEFYPEDLDVSLSLQPSSDPNASMSHSRVSATSASAFAAGGSGSIPSGFTPRSAADASTLYSSVSRPSEVFFNDPPGRQPPSAAAIAAAVHAHARQQRRRHRPVRPSLTFPQFLEALRLVAEEADGTTTSTPRTERALLFIVHDLVKEGCPRALASAATSQPEEAEAPAQRRQQEPVSLKAAAFAAAASGGIYVPGGGFGVDEDLYDKILQSRIKEDKLYGCDGANAGHVWRRSLRGPWELPGSEGLPSRQPTIHRPGPTVRPRQRSNSAGAEVRVSDDVGGRSPHADKRGPGGATGPAVQPAPQPKQPLTDEKSQRPKPPEAWRRTIPLLSDPSAGGKELPKSDGTETPASAPAVRQPPVTARNGAVGKPPLPPTQPTAVGAKERQSREHADGGSGGSKAVYVRSLSASDRPMSAPRTDPRDRPASASRTDPRDGQVVRKADGASQSRINAASAAAKEQDRARTDVQKSSSGRDRTSSGSGGSAAAEAQPGKGFVSPIVRPPYIPGTKPASAGSSSKGSKGTRQQTQSANTTSTTTIGSLALTQSATLTVTVTLTTAPGANDLASQGSATHGLLSAGPLTLTVMPSVVAPPPPPPPQTKTSGSSGAGTGSGAGDAGIGGGGAGDSGAKRRPSGAGSRNGRLLQSRSTTLDGDPGSGKARAPTPAASPAAAWVAEVQEAKANSQSNQDPAEESAFSTAAGAAAAAAAAAGPASPPGPTSGASPSSGGAGPGRPPLPPNHQTHNHSHSHHGRHQRSEREASPPPDVLDPIVKAGQARKSMAGSYCERSDGEGARSRIGGDEMHHDPVMQRMRDEMIRDEWAFTSTDVTTSTDFHASTGMTHGSRSKATGAAGAARRNGAASRGARGINGGGSRRTTGPLERINLEEYYSGGGSPARKRSSWADLEGVNTASGGSFPGDDTPPMAGAPVVAVSEAGLLTTLAKAVPSARTAGLPPPPTRSSGGGAGTVAPSSLGRLPARGQETSYAGSHAESVGAMGQYTFA